MFKSILLPLAKQDISDAAKWYNERQKGLGKRFTQNIRSTVLFIQENPFASAIRYDNVRCAVLDTFPFMIHYTVDKKNTTIIIVAVFHTSLNPEKWMTR